MEKDNLLSLFDSIEVKNTERISKEDRAYCEMLQQDFNKIYGQISAWRDHILSYKDPCPNPAVKVTCRATVSKDITYRSGEHPGYDVLGFSPKYALKGCTDQLFSLCERFENEIIRHFNDTYGCGFENRHLLVRTIFGKNIECSTGYSGKWTKPEFKYECSILPFPEKEASLPSYESVVDYIIEELGGQTFGQKAKELAYNSLQKEIKYNDVSTAKNKVKITGFVFFDNWDNNMTYESKNRLNALFGTIRQHFDWPFEHSIPNIINNLTYGEDIRVFNSPCESFKAYKNRTLELTFKTQEQAQSFGQLCELLKQKAA